MVRLAVLLFAILGATAARAQVTPTHADLTYAVVGGRALQLDLYLPAACSPPCPLLVWVHGGGWSGGQRFPAPAMAVALTQRGLAVASISYRLTSQAALFGGETVTFPAQIHDVKAAIRWLRAHAPPYAIDPMRIGLWGSSAGGHLVALAGTSGDAAEVEGEVGDFDGVSTRVQAVVDYYGPIDLLQMNPDVTVPPGSTIDHDAPNSPESRLIGFDGAGEGIGVLRANAGNPQPPFPDLMALVALTNPITFVDGDQPPFLIVHGTADTSVPFHQSERLRDALLAQGHAPGFVAVAGAGHGGFPPTVQQQAQDFLVAALTDPTLPLFADGFD